MPLVILQNVKIIIDHDFIRIHRSLNKPLVIYIYIVIYCYIYSYIYIYIIYIDIYYTIFGINMGQTRKYVPFPQ